jgi:translocation protein SEC63
MQITLAFNFFEPVRAAMEISQCLLQAIPVGGSPLLQLPGVDVALARDLRMAEKNSVKSIQDLLHLDETKRKKALSSLDQKTYSQAINIAKQIPILKMSNVHFKGSLPFFKFTPKSPEIKLSHLVQSYNSSSRLV